MAEPSNHVALLLPDNSTCETYPSYAETRRDMMIVKTRDADNHSARSRKEDWTPSILKHRTSVAIPCSLHAGDTQSWMRRNK